MHQSQPPTLHPLSTALPRALRLAPLLALLAAALFPFGWLGRVWPAFGAWLDQIFATTLDHAIGHGLIFMTLGLLLLLAFPALLARPARYAALLLLVAVGQEAFQLLYKQRPFNRNDLFDLLIDVAAFTLAFGLARLWVWRRARRRAL